LIEAKWNGASMVEANVGRADLQKAGHPSRSIRPAIL
jgi:hypothetical protein